MKTNLPRPGVISALHSNSLDLVSLAQCGMEPEDIIRAAGLTILSGKSIEKRYEEPRRPQTIMV